MKRILLSALAFGALTTAAMAEPQKMDEGQLGGVSAGLAGLFTDVKQINWANKTASANALNLGGKHIFLSKGEGGIVLPTDGLDLGGTTATATIAETQTNGASVIPTKTVTKDLVEVVPIVVVPTPTDGGKDFGKKDFGKDFHMDLGW